MRKVNLTNETLAEIQRFNALLDLSGDDLKKYIKKNGLDYDANYGEVAIDLGDFSVELCVYSGDRISPAFWGEARLIDNDGNMVFFSEPLDDFYEVEVEDDEETYGCRLVLNESESCYEIKDEYKR